MNATQLSGTIVSQPIALDRTKGIRFVLKARYPSRSENARTGIIIIPCNVVDITKEQREILLGKNYQDFRVELSGRLIRVIYETESGEQIFNTEVIANPNGLLLQKVQ